MTYRELLQLYREGKLEKDKSAQVEQDIEKQEAISEYLCDKDEIPGLEALKDTDGLWQEKENSEETDEEEQRFVKMIQKTIRRTFLKMGAVIGSSVLVIVLCILFLLPQVVSAFYYNPNEVAGKSDENDNITTTRMDLDFSVYSELFLPGCYRNSVNAVSEGYGVYNISIPQTVSYDGRNITVNGKLKRGKLTLYNTDVFKMPYGNTFKMPEEVEEYARQLYYSNGKKEFWGPAGSAAEAYAAIDELDDSSYYIAYASLDKLTDYEDFYQWAEKNEIDANLWCAVYTAGEDGYMCESSEGVGMLINPSGSCLDWNREKYPYLCQLDNQTITDSWGMTEDTQKMETHFISLLSYLKDHEDIVKILDGKELPYDAMIESVKRDGLRIYGFSITCKKDTLLKLKEQPEISYLYAVPVN